MPQEMTETWTAKPGDKVAHVKEQDGLVYLCMTADPKRPWFEVTPRLALRIAYLLMKYAIVAAFKGRR